jgi:penicillin amidase
MPESTGDVSATLRMAVSPGHEHEGIFHMPAGQSGHFLSPHYRDMQRDWVEGRPTPFLPGRTVETLTLLPAAK